MKDSIVPYLGMEFDHARWIDESSKPMRFRVTKIAQGCVYYRPVNGGGSEYIYKEDFHKIVKS
jgi:hypothetical protein